MTQTKIDSVLSICTTPQGSDLNEAGFEALTYVPIGKVVSLPDFGVAENSVVQNYVGDQLSQASKGFRQGQESSITVGDDPNDTGQDALHAASLTRTNYAFSLESSDSPDGVLTNTVRYARAIVMRPMFTGGEGEAFDNYEFPITLNQEPARVKPE